MTECQWRFQSDIGPLYLVADSKSLKGSYWDIQNTPLLKSLRTPVGPAMVLSKAVDQLKQYFSGKRQKFKLPLDPSGTAFQKKVWLELRKIPYGQTCSYRDIAHKIGHPKAVRAVGSANGKNPLCIIVPCHRVISSDGSIGGYSGGLSKKRKLLKSERAK